MPEIINLYSIESLLRALDNTSITSLSIFESITVSTQSTIIDCRRHGKVNLQVSVSGFSSGDWTINLLGGSSIIEDLGGIYISAPEDKTQGQEISGVTWNSLSTFPIESDGTYNFVFDKVTNFVLFDAIKTGDAGSLSAWVSPPYIVSIIS